MRSLLVSTSISLFTGYTQDTTNDAQTAGTHAFFEGIMLAESRDRNAVAACDVKQEFTFFAGTFFTVDFNDHYACLPSVNTASNLQVSRQLPHAMHTPESML